MSDGASQRDQYEVTLVVPHKTRTHTLSNFRYERGMNAAKSDTNPDLTPLSQEFAITRVDALARLHQFVPHAGNAYGVGRNSDLGPGKSSAVSRLSPYLRHRLITEQEVATAVLARHRFLAAEKYVQEVLWRTYWKGWLEMRPQVWSRFVTERDTARASFPNARAITAAENGMTGIEGFDDWARELVETGYLHNHARMWFASIWIFTLRLPWALGADFFLRHLIDADAASNTLSWRWVAGLQTAGKTYLATADNIARFTGGRFAPKGLAKEAIALTEAPMEPPAALPETGVIDPEKPSLLLVTHEDMSPESVIKPDINVSQAIIATDESLLWGDASKHFVKAAASDAVSRIEAHFKCAARPAATLDASTLIVAAQAAGAAQIVTPYAPVGPVADALTQIAPMIADEGISLIEIRRDWDTHFWPHAKKGFFPFKEHIPKMLSQFGIV
jgi:deoxyribodipyrimidine photo-lyase